MKCAVAQTMRVLLFLVFLFAGSVSRCDGTCFDVNLAPIDGCECHESCGECGYNDNPINSNDCQTCANGSPVQIEFDDGSGSCTEAIYETALCFDETQNRIEDCVCHETCLACGYSAMPIASTNCIECQDGTAVNIVNETTGTGYCGTSAPTDTEAPNPTMSMNMTNQPTMAPATGGDAGSSSAPTTPGLLQSVVAIFALVLSFAGTYVL